MKPLLFLLAPVLLCAAEIRVAVIDIQPANCSAAEAKAVTDALRSKVVSSSFRLVDRARVEQVLSADKGRCADAECAVRIGKLVSADKVIVGTVSRIGQYYDIAAEFVDVQKGRSERSSKQMAASLERVDEAALAVVNDFAGVKARVPETPALTDTRIATAEVYLALAPFAGMKYSVFSYSGDFSGLLADTGLMFNADTIFFGKHGFRVMFGYELSIASRPLSGINRVFLLQMLDLGAFFLTRLSPEMYAGIGTGYKFESPLQRKVYMSIPGAFADDVRSRRGEIFLRGLFGYTLWLSDTFGLAAEGYAGYSFFDDPAGVSHYIDAGISIRTVFRIYKSLK